MVASPTRIPRAQGIPRAREILRAPETWLLLAALAQLAVTVWWIGIDSRTPDAETARQIGFAFRYTDAINGGDLLAPFRGAHVALQDLYPPLHEGLTAYWAVLFGKSIDGAMVVQLLVYFPLILVGSYGAGRVLFGRAGGALAALFVLALPVFGPIFHLDLVDTATLAFAAPAIWLLLETRRFERRGWALAAGIVVGLGMLTKTNFAFVWPGLVAVMLLRGGWRQWRNVAIFAAAVLVVGLPWYIVHADELRHQVEFYGQDKVATYTPFLGDLHKWSLRHLSYYPRALMEVDVYLPLLCFFAVGTVVALVRFVRTRLRSDYTPELLAGLLVFWVGLLNVDTADWRFALAGLVYVALLSTGWIVALPRAAALGAAALLAAIFVVNTVTTNFALGKKVSVAVHGVSATVLSPDGVVVNKPNGDSRLQDALDGLPKLGIRAYWVSGLSESPPNFELAGLGTMANIAGLTFVDRPRLAADVVAVITRGVRPDDPPPCAWIAGHGVGAPAVYLARGPVTTKKLTDVIYGAPVRDLNLVCPSRS